jgi:hypothetical protein
MCVCVCLGQFDPVVVSSTAQCYVLISSPHSPTPLLILLPGSDVLLHAVISASRLVSYTNFSFSRCATAGVSISPTSKVSEHIRSPKTLAQRPWSSTFQETCPATSKSLRLPGCSAPRSIQRPTQLSSLSSSFLHLTSSSPPHLANFLSPRLGFSPGDAQPSGLQCPTSALA